MGRHFGRLTIRWVDILEGWQFDGSTFWKVDTLMGRHFIALTILWVDILEGWQFDGSTFYCIDNLMGRHFRRSAIWRSTTTWKLTFVWQSSCWEHRNLRTRMSMFALVQQTFWAKKTCKKSADLHPRQGNLLQRNIFTGPNKTSPCNTK
jgi:hypothetical protein